MNFQHRNSLISIESLEARTLFSASPVVGSTPVVTLDSGVVTIVGTPGNDTVAVTYYPLPGFSFGQPAAPASWSVQFDGKTVAQYNASDVSTFQIFVGAGNDSVDFLGIAQAIPGLVRPALTVSQETLGAALVCSGAGNDTIQVIASGDDTLRGGAGDDSIHSSNSNDSILGGAGNDTLVCNEGGTVLGQGGNDSISGPTDFGIEASFLFEGGAGNDTIVGGVGQFQGYGASGQPNLYAPTAMTLQGNTGNDRIVAAAGGGNLIVGGPGSDTLVGSTNTRDVDTLSAVGGSGDELLPGVRDVLLGGGNPQVDTGV